MDERRVTLTLPAELFDRLSDAAKAAERPLKMQARVILREALERESIS